MQGRGIAGLTRGPDYADPMTYLDMWTGSTYSTASEQ